MKREYLLAWGVFLLLYIAISFFYIEKYNKVSLKVESSDSFECNIKNPDPDGYLLEICQYLNENSSYVFPSKKPDDYSVVSVEEEAFVHGMFNLIFVKVYLDGGNGAGDIALIDKKTKTVLGFSVADR